jgi:hypothetical protein
MCRTNEDGIRAIQRTDLRSLVHSVLFFPIFFGDPTIDGIAHQPEIFMRAFPNANWEVMAKDVDD